MALHSVKVLQPTRGTPPPDSFRRGSTSAAHTKPSRPGPVDLGKANTTYHNHQRTVPCGIANQIADSRRRTRSAWPWPRPGPAAKYGNEKTRHLGNSPKHRVSWGSKLAGHRVGGQWPKADSCINRFVSRGGQVPTGSEKFPPQKEKSCEPCQPLLSRQKRDVSPPAAKGFLGLIVPCLRFWGPHAGPNFRTGLEPGD